MRGERLELCVMRVWARWVLERQGGSCPCTRLALARTSSSASSGPQYLRTHGIGGDAAFSRCGVPARDPAEAEGGRFMLGRHSNSCVGGCGCLPDAARL